MYEFVDKPKLFEDGIVVAVGDDLSEHHLWPILLDSVLLAGGSRVVYNKKDVISDKILITSNIEKKM